MKKIFMILMLLLTFSVSAKNTIVIVETNKGNLELELFDKKAPQSVDNFLKYVDKKFYNGTIFHRVIDGFMVQGGGFDSSLQKKKTMRPIKNEATNGLSNSFGTLAMARTSVVDSATAQFFINVKDNRFLDHRGTSPGSFGYAVFGKVIKGMSVLNMITKTKTRRNGNFQNLPTENIIMVKVYKK